jgi:hypothetical protein
LPPFLSPVSGILSRRFPGHRRFGHTPAGTYPFPPNTLSFVIGGKTGGPQGLEKALFTPEPEIAVNGA